MEIKTCEEYVLNELKEVSEAAAKGEQALDDIALLKEIFMATKNPDTNMLDIMMRNDVFDVNKDPKAGARIEVINRLFYTAPQEAAPAEEAAGDTAK